MNLIQLRYFQTVCACGNLTQAAELLHISQPSLSSAIHALEKEFGVDLFIRQYRGMELTAEGERLLKMSRSLTEDADKMLRIMQELGFQRLVDNHAVWTYYAKDIIFELHDHMFYEHLTNEVDYPAYFDRAWDYVGQELWESFHFLYLITHLAKHTINKGMGFRAYLDLIFFCRIPVV